MFIKPQLIDTVGGRPPIPLQNCWYENRAILDTFVRYTCLDIISQREDRLPISKQDDFRTTRQLQNVLLKFMQAKQARN